MGEVVFSPSFDRFGDGAGRELVRLGHPLVDGYLELVAARARPNTLLAQAYDLKRNGGASHRLATAAADPGALQHPGRHRPPCCSTGAAPAVPTRTRYGCRVDAVSRSWQLPALLCPSGPGAPPCPSGPGAPPWPTCTTSGRPPTAATSQRTP